MSRHPVDSIEPLDSNESDCYEYLVLPVSDLVHIEEEQRQYPNLRVVIDKLSRGAGESAAGLFALRGNVLYRQIFFLLAPSDS